MVRPYLQDEKIFLANYSDGLTDLSLNTMIEKCQTSKKVGSFLCVPPSQSFHVVSLAEDGRVQTIKNVRDAGLLINGGFFVFRQEIFDYMEEAEELVIEPFQRLIEKDLLMGYRYNRFWCMDTFKEQQELTDLLNQGVAPWEVWREELNGGRSCVGRRLGHGH